MVSPLPEIAITLLKGLFTFLHIKEVAGRIKAIFQCDSIECKGKHIFEYAISSTISTGVGSLIDIKCDSCGQIGEAKITAK